MSRFDADFWALHAFIERLERPRHAATLPSQGPTENDGDQPISAAPTARDGQGVARQPQCLQHRSHTSASPAKPSRATRPQPISQTNPPRSFSRLDFTLWILFAAIALSLAIPPWGSNTAQVASFTIAVFASFILSRAGQLRAHATKASGLRRLLFFIPVVNIPIGLTQSSLTAISKPLRLGRLKFLATLLWLTPLTALGILLLYSSALSEAAGGQWRGLSDLPAWTFTKVISTPAEWNARFRIGLLFLFCSLAAALWATAMRWRDIGWSLPIPIFLALLPVIWVAFFLIPSANSSTKP